MQSTAQKRPVLLFGARIFSPPTWVKMGEKSNKQDWWASSSDELSVCITGYLFSTLRFPVQKDFATEQEFFWRDRTHPTQGQTAKSEAFPHTVLSFTKTQHSGLLDSARCSQDTLRSSFGRVYFTLGFLFWIEKHWIAKCCSLETYTQVEASFCQLKKINHKLSEAFFSDRDDKLNEVSSGSGDAWLKSISSKSGGKSESSAWE